MKKSITPHDLQTRLNAATSESNFSMRSSMGGIFATSVHLPLIKGGGRLHQLDSRDLLLREPERCCAAVPVVLHNTEHAVTFTFLPLILGTTPRQTKRHWHRCHLRSPRRTNAAVRCLSSAWS